MQRHLGELAAPGDRPELVITSAPPVVVIDPLFDDAGAAAMVELCARFGRYGLYIEHEQIHVDLGNGLLPRHDSVLNFLRTKHVDGVSTEELAARTSYFREEYAYAGRPLVEGIEPFLHHPAFIDAATTVHGGSVVEPAIAYANLYLPGQELAVHTDVPEFRGANRKVLPQWLLVVMHHSGLFDAWRLPIATGIAYFHDAAGGALVTWPDGPDGAPVRHAPRTNTAVVLDTDSMFHGVDPVGDAPVAVPPLPPGSQLTADGPEHWVLRDAAGEATARYATAHLRFSVSWKAYVFPDEAARDRWRDHTDDLTAEMIVERLLADLHRRGRIDANATPDREVGLLAIDEYVRFPT